MLRYMGKKSRDNSRTPMQWNTEPNAGFTTGEPWIMVNPNYLEINAEEQLGRPESVFNFYKKLIQLRKTMEILTFGDYQLLMPDHSDLFVYMRSYKHKKLLIACNFVNEERLVVMPENYTSRKILISNDETSKVFTTVVDAHRYKQRADMLLGPFGAVVLTN